MISISQLHGIVQAYLDNADYDTADSLQKAKNFVVACRKLLSPAVTPESLEKAGLATRFDLSVIQTELLKAERFVADGGDKVSPQDTFYLDLTCPYE